MLHVVGQLLADLVDDLDGVTRPVGVDAEATPVDRLVKQPDFPLGNIHGVVLLDVPLNFPLGNNVLTAVSVKLIEQVLVAASLAAVRLAQLLDEVAAGVALLFVQTQHCRALAQRAGQREDGCQRGGVVPLVRLNLGRAPVDAGHLVFPDGPLKASVPRPYLSAAGDCVPQPTGEEVAGNPQLRLFVVDRPAHAEDFGRGVGGVVVGADRAEVGFAVGFKVNADLHFSLFRCKQGPPL